MLWLGVLVPGHRRQPSGSRANLVHFGHGDFHAYLGGDLDSLLEAVVVFWLVGIPIEAPVSDKTFVNGSHNGDLDIWVVVVLAGLGETEGTVAVERIWLGLQCEPFARSIEDDLVLVQPEERHIHLIVFGTLLEISHGVQVCLRNAVGQIILVDVVIVSVSDNSFL